MILLNKPRHSQPQGGARVNWSLPISRGLALTVCDNLAEFPGSITSVNIPQRRLGNRGVGAYVDSSTVVATFQGPAMPALSELTMLALCDVPAGGSGSAPFRGMFGRWDGLSNRRPAIGRNNSGALELSYFNGSGGAPSGGTVATSAGSYSFIARQSASGASLYQNGVLLGSDAVTRTWDANSDTYRIGCFRGGALSENYIAVYPLVAMWWRALSDAEIASITANPWQLFQPRRIWVPVEAAAGGGITTTGIASAEAFGSPSILAAVSATGIASAEAFGSAAIRAGITAAGIASAEAFGTPSVQAGIATTGVASTAAIGSPSLQAGITVAGIASAEALGAPAVQAGITATGIATAEALGEPAVRASIAATGIASAEAFGSPIVGAVDGVLAVGIPSAEAFGSPAVQAVLAAAGIVTGEAFGAPAVQARVAAAGIASAEAIGAPSLAARISAAGIASSEYFGDLVIGEFSISCVGIESGEEFGLPVVGRGQPLSAAPTGRRVQNSGGRMNVQTTRRPTYRGGTR